MYVIQKMRLNRFEPRPIVTNRGVYLAVGAKEATVQSKENFDCLKQPTLFGASKLKVLGLAYDITRKAIEHKQKEGTEPLKTPAVEM